MANKEYRTERDSMGMVEVPAQAYYGAQTQRAVENFNISPYRIPQAMRRALAMIKGAAAGANSSFGLLDEDIADAVVRSAREVESTSMEEHFPLDVFQTGSGTSWNMNMNEVLAGMASRILGKPGSVHPNDHVNLGQSSNDVIPSAMNIAARIEGEKLLLELGSLRGTLMEKAEEFADQVKLGRTHLQDAVPMTVGQEFAAWAGQLERCIDHIGYVMKSLEELPLGGTAIGTGLNSSRSFAKEAVAEISRSTGIAFYPSENPFVQIAARDEQVALMGGLNGCAVVLMKIAQDIRLLSSGPGGGLGELSLPELQPGSSIMPGKVNPVIPEMVIQVAAFVMGKQVSVTIGGQNAPLQLNIMQPLIAHEVLCSLDLLTRASARFRERCISGITVRKGRMEEVVERSPALVTPLATQIGYDRAAKIAQKAHREGKTVRQVVIEEGVLTSEETSRVMDPSKMVGPF